MDALPDGSSDMLPLFSQQGVTTFIAKHPVDCVDSSSLDCDGLTWLIVVRPLFSSVRCEGSEVSFDDSNGSPRHSCDGPDGRSSAKSWWKGMIWMGGFFANGVVVTVCCDDSQLFVVCSGPISDGFGPFHLLPASDIPWWGHSDGWIVLGGVSLCRSFVRLQDLFKWENCGTLIFTNMVYTSEQTRH
jgi:hypothetical protein